ncbi:MAG TPA: hypothetical protein VFG19_07305 [Geobacteraceae bacterium]|nr:hypothetical protein [Geobacteraceae bacterium]
MPVFSVDRDREPWPWKCLFGQRTRITEKTEAFRADEGVKTSRILVIVNPFL